MGGLAKDDKERIDCDETMGIQDLATRRFGEISDGERQKGANRWALAQEADVLLLDEPAALSICRDVWKSSTCCGVGPFQDWR